MKSAMRGQDGNRESTETNREGYRIREMEGYKHRYCEQKVRCSTVPKEAGFKGGQQW